MNNTKIVYRDRIDVFEGIGINKTNASKCVKVSTIAIF